MLTPKPIGYKDAPMDLEYAQRVGTDAAFKGAARINDIDRAMAIMINHSLPIQPFVTAIVATIRPNSL